MLLIAKIFSIALLAFLTVLPGEAVAEEGWEKDLDTALAEAKKNDKLVLADFTGSDWCGWCIKLHNEVFVKEEFKSFAGKNLVLCAIDFPRDKSLVEEKQAEKNDKYKKKYEIRGFPTIFLLEPDGSILLQTGYREGGAVPYVDYLGSMVEARAKVKSFFAQAGGKPDAAAARKLVEEIPEDAAVLRARVVLAAYPKSEGDSRAEAAYDLITAKQDHDGRILEGLRKAAGDGKTAAARAAAGYQLLRLGHDGGGKYEEDLREVADSDTNIPRRAKAAYRLITLQKDKDGKYLDYLRGLGEKDKEGLYKKVRSQQVGNEIMTVLNKVARAVQSPSGEKDEKKAAALEADARQLIDLTEEAVGLIDEATMKQRFLVFQALAYRALDDQEGVDKAWGRAVKVDPKAQILEQAKGMIKPSDK